MGYARVRISDVLFLDVMHFPPGTVLHDVTPFREGGGYCDLEIVVSHPELRNVPLQEGEKPPLVTPSFRKNELVEFVSWGQDK